MGPLCLLPRVNAFLNLNMYVFQTNIDTEVSKSNEADKVEPK